MLKEIISNIVKKYFIFIFLLFVFFAHNTAHNLKNESVLNHKKEKTNDAYLKYKATYNNHKEFASIVFHTIIHKDNIIEAFEQKNRKLLQNLLTEDYEELKKFNVKQLHFHLKNNDSFLRMHRPNKFGDNLTNARATVKYVNEFKKPIDGFEEGKVFNGFRYVYPLFNKNNIHIGSVEISFSALLFVKELYSNYKMKCNLYINTDIVKQKVFNSEKSNYKKSIFDNFSVQKSIVKYINDNNLNDLSISDKILKQINKKLLKKENFSIYNKDKLITFLFLKNSITNKSVAFLTIVSNDNYKNQREKNIIVILSLIIIILLIILIVFYKNQQSKNQIKIDLNDKLQKNIELKNLSKKLKDNLRIYSDHIIYSKTDLRGNIIEVSEAFCKISEYSKEELLGKKHNIVRSKNISKDVYDDMWNTLRNNKTWKGEIENISKHGNIYWINSIIYPEFNAAGEKISYIAIAHNITSAKKLEFQHNRLMQADKLASMGEMITNISHQWRQPLSVISTSASGVQMQSEMGEINKDFLAKACNNININTQFLSKTIDEFRNYTSNDDVVEKINLKNIISNFKNLVQYLIDDNNIKFINNINDDVVIECTKNNLIQCFINFFNNSKDAFILNGIEEKLFILNTYKENEKVIITIQDSANGIEEKIINKIFEPYFTTKHQSQGTGLGLHMCYNIIENLNGTIEVENKEFEYNNKTYNGACFKITLEV